MSTTRRLSDLAADLGAEVVGDGAHEVTGVRPLESAGPGHLSFLHNPKYLEAARKSHAGAILIKDQSLLPDRNLLVCDEPYLALARAVALFHPAERPEPGIHESAVIAPDAVLGHDVSIGPLAVIASEVTIGDGTVIGPECVLSRGAMVGRECLLHPRVVVADRCRIGNRCILHSGVVVGSDGYGFATVQGVHHKIPQVGIVVIEDDVELGACVCVDRAALGETRVGRGTKVDNLVQIAHNVEIGEHCLLVAQCGISGSTRIGHHVVLAGQAGCAGHLKIGNEAVIAARAVVIKDVPEKGFVSGYPARPHREWLRANANLQRLDELRGKVKELEQRLAELEGSST